MAQKKDGLKELQKKALAHFRKPSPDETGDFYVVVKVADKPLVRSGSMTLEPTLNEFWNELCNGVKVEIEWWCADHECNQAESKKMINDIAPVLYHIDVAHNQFLPITEVSYQKAKASNERIDRQFAFVDTRLPIDEIRNTILSIVKEIDQ